ncbi:CadC family transcriptional regulator, partial [Pseudoalteromonas ruthenica]
VQEQVLAQSVKELRDIFGSDIIKTFPRNGYQWVAELTSYRDSTSRPVYKKPFFQIGIVAGIILVFAAVFTSMFTSPKLTIALLPV